MSRKQMLEEELAAIYRREREQIQAEKDALFASIKANRLAEVQRLLALGMTQKEIAKLMDVSQVFVSLILKGAK